MRRGTGSSWTERPGYVSTHGGRVRAQVDSSAPSSMSAPVSIHSASYARRKPKTVRRGSSKGSLDAVTGAPPAGAGRTHKVRGSEPKPRVGLALTVEEEPCTPVGSLVAEPPTREAAAEARTASEAERGGPAVPEGRDRVVDPPSESALLADVESELSKLRGEMSELEQLAATPGRAVAGAVAGAGGGGSKSSNSWTAATPVPARARARGATPAEGDGSVNERAPVQPPAMGLQLEIRQSLQAQPRSNGLAASRTSFGELSVNGTVRLGSFEIREAGLVQRSGRERGAANGPHPHATSSAMEPGVGSSKTGTAMPLPSAGPSPRGSSSSWSRNLVDLGFLGSGASSTVRKALHVPSLTVVAQKIMPIFDPHRRKQLVHELRTLHENLAPLTASTGPSCPHIVAFYDAFVQPQEGTVSMVVEYMDGGSLQDILDRGRRADETVLVNIAFQVLKGLVFLHERRQIHRDLKPGNLLIDHLGRVKLSDFGIARELDASWNGAETFVGTFTYMSPERLAGEPYSCPCDIWGLGLTVLALALGRFPYSESIGYWGLLQEIKERASPPPPAHLSPEMRDFLEACLRKDPRHRPSAAELLRMPVFAGCNAGESPLPGPEEKSPSSFSHPEQMSDTARRELEDMVHVVQNFYQELWSNEREAARPLSVPEFSRAAVERLARQIGVDPRSARLRFAMLLRELRANAVAGEQVGNDGE